MFILNKFLCDLIITVSMFSDTTSAPSPQISVYVSFEVVNPPVQVHPVSAFHASFTWRATGFSSSLIGKL